MRFLFIHERNQDQAQILRVLQDHFQDAEIVLADTQDAYEQGLATESIDLVITEHRLGWTDGLSVLYDAHRLHADVPVIIITAPGNERLAIEGFRAGLVDYVTKDHLDELVPAVRASLRSEKDGIDPATHWVLTRGTLHAVLEALPVGVAVSDPTGRFAFVNPAAHAITGGQVTGDARNPAGGYTIHSPDGSPIPPDELPLPRALTAGKALRNVEIVYRHDDGEERTALASATPIYTPDGDLKGAVATLQDITDRKEAEAALRESEARFRFVATNMPDVLFFQDLDLRYTWIFNPAGSVEVSKVVGKTDFDLLPYDEALHLTAIKRGVLATGEGTRVEVQLSPGGITRWYKAAYEPSRNSDGDIVGIVNYSRDITERKEAEESLHRHAAELKTLNEQLRQFTKRLAVEQLLLQAIYDTVPAMFAIYDPVIQDVVLSKHVHTVTGWTPEDTAMTNIMELIYPEPDYRQEVADYMESLQPGFKDLHMVAKDGHTIESTWANVQLPDGRQVGIGIDIAERKHAEMALRESEERYSELFANSHFGLALTQMPEGIIVEVNDAFLKLFGYQRSELIGHTSVDLGISDPESQAQVRAELKKRGSVRALEVVRLAKSGEQRILSIDIDHVAIGGTPHVLTTIQDVTERKQAETRLTQYTAELEEANQANRLLLQEVNHRVKNNLTAILGLIVKEQLQLDRELPEHEGKERSLEALHDLSDRVRSLATAHTLLSASGWRPLEIGDLAHRVIQASLSASEKPRGKATVKVHCNGVRIGPDHAHNLALILGELTTNTIKYGYGSDGLRITVNCELHDDEVRLRYRDNGPGYSESALAGEDRSVGLGIVHSVITHSLRGSWHLSNEQGAMAELRFPAEIKLSREALKG